MSKRQLEALGLGCGAAQRGLEAFPAGLRVHASATLDPARDVIRDPYGLRRTSVAGTLVDLADALPANRLRRALERAELLPRARRRCA